MNLPSENPVEKTFAFEREEWEAISLFPGDIVADDDGIWKTLGMNKSRNTVSVRVCFRWVVSMIHHRSILPTGLLEDGTNNTLR